MRARSSLAVVVIAATAWYGPSLVGATSAATAADTAIEQFLERRSGPIPYKAFRRLEASNKGRAAWMEVTTGFSRTAGFEYQILDAGGSDYIRDKVLQPLLRGEQEMIARGEGARSAIVPSNYEFQPNGIDADGLANILLAPRRKDGVLVAGTLFVKPVDGELVKLQGRLAKNPSFWVKRVDIVRSYKNLNGAVLPVELESTAQLRMLGPATLRMTYDYSEVNGQPVGTPAP